MKMPRPLMVITLKLHPFHIIFLMGNRSCRILILTFQHFHSMKLAEFFVNFELELVRPAPPHSLSGPRSEHIVELLLASVNWCRQ